MPELAEVQYYRSVWDHGLGDKILTTKIHSAKRIFRGVPAREFQTRLEGAILQKSWRCGKQLLFGFSKGVWLGVHLGMTGKLLLEDTGFQPAKHDHLVLYQRSRALVFHDPRLFGRIRFAVSADPPDWWKNLPASVDSLEFRRPAMEGFLRRHSKLPIKTALLLQSGFPGIGNWMADEILWRAKIHPLAFAGELQSRQLMALWTSLRFVCQGALEHIAPDFSDPPVGWLFHERWHRGGKCPKHGTPLRKEMVRGRNTAWCPRCQPVVSRIY